MTCFIQKGTGSFLRKYYLPLLALVWVAGLFFGFFLFHSTFHFPLGNLIPSFTYSFTDLLLSSIFPFLICTLIVYISHPFLLILFSFLRASSFIFSFCILENLFTDAGWLFAMLLALHSVLLLPLFFWYASHHIVRRASFNIVEVCIVFVVCFLVALAEYLSIAPFAENIINYWKG